jgi:hypothetical protein
MINMRDVGHNHQNVAPWRQEKLITAVHPFLNLWRNVLEEKETKVSPNFF